MRCISDELIQKYIDKEVSEKEYSLVRSHLSSCSKCAERVEERRNAAERLKNLLAPLNNDDFQVPVFLEPEKQGKRIPIHLNKLIYVAAAASLLLLFIVFHQKPKDEIELIYSYEVEYEYNANLPLSEQEMVIEIIDTDGKLIKY